MPTIAQAGRLQGGQALERAHLWVRVSEGADGTMQMEWKSTPAASGLLGGGWARVAQRDTDTLAAALSEVFAHLVAEVTAARRTSPKEARRAARRLQDGYWQVFDSMLDTAGEVAGQLIEAERRGEHGG